MKTMNEKIIYTDVPKTYLYCNHLACPRAKGCLRHHATLSIPPEVPSYTAINPPYIAGNENNCRYFQPFQTSRFASGITHILDNIPHATAVAIRKELYSLMGRSMYYRTRNKERLLHPREQEQIAAIFLKYGVNTEPEFDEYIDKYDW